MKKFFKFVLILAVIGVVIFIVSHAVSEKNKAEEARQEAEDALMEAELENQKLQESKLATEPSKEVKASEPDKEEETKEDTEDEEDKEESEATEESKDEGESLTDKVEDALIRDDIKEAIDSYEAFVDEYCEFMKSYDPSDLSMLTKYADLISKEADMAKEFEDIEEKDLTEAEALYYSEVELRCSNKMMKALSEME